MSGSQILLIVFVWFLNFAISWWNAFACGACWVESKSVGGWRHFMTWMAAIMSASGFIWCYLIVEALIANQMGAIDQYWMGITLQLGYIIIIPGILFSGLMITMESWAIAYRQGGILNYGVATYNTFAQIHNTYSAITSFGDAFKSVMEAFFGDRKSSSSSSNSSGAAGLVALLLVLLAVILGILTTTVIIRRTAANQPLLSLDELRERKLAKQAG